MTSVGRANALANKLRGQSKVTLLKFGLELKYERSLYHLLSVKYFKSCTVEVCFDNMVLESNCNSVAKLNMLSTQKKKQQNEKFLSQLDDVD